MISGPLSATIGQYYTVIPLPKEILYGLFRVILLNFRRYGNSAEAARSAWPMASGQYSRISWWLVGWLIGWWQPCIMCWRFGYITHQSCFLIMKEAWFKSPLGCKLTGIWTIYIYICIFRLIDVLTPYLKDTF